LSPRKGLGLAKILIFNPPHPEGKGFTREGRCTQEAGIWGTQWPPLSLATIASVLLQDGHQVRVLDCPAMGQGVDALVEVVGAFRPDLAVWNTATPTLAADLAVASRIRQVAPRAVTAVMGTHVTAFPDAALEVPHVDLVVRAEPEHTVRDLALLGDPPGAAVQGVSWRGKDGTLRNNPDRPFLPPEAIPAASWEALDLSPYRLPLKARPFLIVAPVRGCPYPCSFCTAPVYYGRRLRKRPLGSVAEEICRGVSLLGVRDFFVWADTFTADREYVHGFCREILSRGLRISWSCNSRVDTLDPETLVLMKRAGLWMVSFGLESGSDAILKRSGKGITVAQSERAVRMAHDHGVRTSGHFILGLPGETRETLAQTISLALTLPLDIAQFYAAAPFPGTRLHTEAVQSGWLRPGMEFSQGRAVMDLPGLPGEQVDLHIRHAYRRFYGRPRAWWNILSMLEPGAFRGQMKNARQFLLRF